MEQIITNQSLNASDDIFTGSGGLPEAATYHNTQSHGFFAHIVKKPDKRSGNMGMIQKCHRISSLALVIDLADEKLDNYISQAEFLKPNRRVVNIARLNLNFVDLDIYNTDPRWNGFVSTPQMAGAVRFYCYDNHILPPSITAFSGRGLYVKYLTNTLPRQALPRWNAVQRRLVELFQPFGADHRCKDASRVLRLMGTTNTKSNEIVRVLDVEQENGKPKVYDFEYLAREILETDRGTINRNRAEQEAKAARRAGFNVIDGGKQGGNTGGLKKLNPMRLNWDRLEDVRKLADLRGWTKNGIPEGYREVYLFWATNFMLLSGATHPGQMFHEVTALAREVCPALVPEVRQSLSTLYRKAQAHSAGEKVEFNGKKFSPLYTPKNQTLIDYLNITPDEERQLGTIISEAEAADRHRKRDEVKRREAGAVDRARYLETAEMKRTHALLLRAKGMKQREIAAEMGISIGAVNAYLKSAT